MTTRCPWAKIPLAVTYHDQEWGVPVRDDARWFEFLVLGGAQAGLNWDTILKKRPGYRAAFADFDPDRVASFTPQDQERLLTDPGIIRNRQKIASALNNARAFVRVRDQYGGFNPYIWTFVNGRPIQNRWSQSHEIPAVSEVSETLSKDLKSRGFTFVGSTICYALMQAAGMVNDHLVSCHRYESIVLLGAARIV